MTDTPTEAQKVKKREKTILLEANNDAIEMCHKILAYMIPHLRRLPPSTACDAEEIAGLAQKYLQEYGD